MAVKISKDGVIHVTATTHLPLLRRPKVTQVATAVQFTKTGLRITATMPGIIARNQQMVTMVELSIQDLTKILRHKLKDMDADIGERWRNALLAITAKNMAGWLKFFLARLA